MIRLRWAEPQDRDDVQAYLFANMGKIPFERWRNILDCRWSAGFERYGVIVERNGQLAGFLGIVFADREIAGKTRRTGNITSWYLDKDLRRGGLGADMLALVTEPEGITYTATSPNFRSGALLAKVGWQMLEDKRLFWRPDGAASSPGFPVASGFSAISGKVDAVAARILSDHAGLNITPHLVTVPAVPPLFLITYSKEKGNPPLSHVEILYASSLSALARHARDLANTIVPRQNAVLSMDSRFCPGGLPDDEKKLEVARFFKPCGLNREAIDFMYSEVVLLDLKLY